MSATINAPAVFTISETPRASRVSISTLTPDSSYPTGGYAVSPQQLGLSLLEAPPVCHLSGSAANNTAVQASYNPATTKVQLLASTGTSPVGLAEAANNTNLSGLTVTILAFGV